MRRIASALLCLFLFPLSVPAAGNTGNDSLARARRTLEEQVCVDHRLTLYCGAAFGADGRVSLPEGFVLPIKGTVRLEWGHVIPLESLARTFAQWRGSPQCVRGGRPFRGRACVEATRGDYRRMQADMYNMYPVMGVVEGVRGQRDFALLPHEPPVFGACALKAVERKVEPPARARGQIARTSLYMQEAYPRWRMSRRQKELMAAWNRQYPVDAWECARARRIEKLQGNENPFVKRPCRKAGLW